MCTPLASKNRDIHSSVWAQSKRDHSNLVETGKRDPVKRAVGLTHSGGKRGPSQEQQQAAAFYQQQLVAQEQYAPPKKTVLGG